ncbi:MAG: hypothetical protein N4A76_04105 [Firmicutes bacterium]|jgi:hypothetical protein|nr:hypothetical protein [Bacillota bacterium]
MKRKIIVFALGIALCTSSATFATGDPQGNDALVAKTNQSLVATDVVKVENKVMTQLPEAYKSLIPELEEGAQLIFDNAEYTGSMVNNIPNGMGSLKFSYSYTDDLGTKYKVNCQATGEFKDYFLNGQGEFIIDYKMDSIHNDTRKYKGNFHYGLINGSGTHIYITYNGSGSTFFEETYEGNFKFGQMNGNFKVTTKHNEALYPNTNLIVETGIYKNSKKDNHWIKKEFNKSGNLVSFIEGQYEEGFKIGRWMGQDSYGNSIGSEYTPVYDFTREIK